MELNKLFKKFALISVIMPYYDHTHRCFLLLTELCKESRATLTEWYNEFVSFMREHWQTFYWGYYFKGEFPPCDLYKFDFANWQHNFKRFIDTFGTNRYKFGDTYINRRVNMKDIIIDSFDQNLIKLANDIKYIEENYSYFILYNKETNKNEKRILKIIDKVIIEYYLRNDEEADETIRLANLMSVQRYYRIRIWNKFENNLCQLCTWCVTGVIRILISLFECSIYFFCLANL